MQCEDVGTRLGAGCESGMKPTSVACVVGAKLPAAISQLLLREALHVPCSLHPAQQHPHEAAIHVCLQQALSLPNSLHLPGLHVPEDKGLLEVSPGVRISPENFHIIVSAIKPTQGRGAPVAIQ